MSRGIKKEKNKKKKFLIIFIILVVIITIGLFVFKKVNRNTENDENKIAVQLVSILTGSADNSQNRFSGVVVSQKTIKLQKEENRTVKKVYVEVGQAVKAGDKLFEYDTDEVSAKIDQETLEVEKLQNAIANAQKQIESINAAKAENPGGDHTSYNLEIQTQENEIKQTQYNITAKNNEIKRLRKSLQNTVIKSEIDGIVQSINDSEHSDTNDMGMGDTQDNSYMSIMQTGQYRIKGIINEQNMFSISVGEKVIIHSRVDENITWTGTIESIDTSNPEKNSDGYGYMVMGDDGSNKSSKYPFYITLDSMDGLMMGQHVYIEKNIGQTEKKEGMWLSNYFITEENGEYFVWTSNKKDKLEKRKIKVGDRNEESGEYQILEGLTNEDYIAIPQEGLAEGLEVNKFDTLDVPVNIDMTTDNMMVEENVDLNNPVVQDGTVTPEEGTAVPEILPQTSSDAIQ